jgi:hypothetical protein
MDSPKKKAAAKAALLVYSVVVLLLAWWPWNVWLVVGAAYASGLKYRDGRRLLSPDAGKATVYSAKRVEEIFVSRNRSDALQEYARVVGHEHFGHAPR